MPLRDRAPAVTSAAAPRFRIEPWPTERPLLALSVVAALGLWGLLALSVIGLVYALLLGLLYSAAQRMLVAHVRGSGVKLGPDQLPDVHAAVERLASEMGMPSPDAYLMRAGGWPNAFATRRLGGEIVVLHSELLEACGENAAARDMILGRELAHLKCGHRRARWLLAPARLLPFLGSALARAREYTCDRYGLAAAGGIEGAKLGLAILAAGPRFGRALNLEAFHRQRADLNTGAMTLAEWLSSRPPLAKRIAALDPSLAVPGYDPAGGRRRAAALAVAPVLVLAAVGSAAAPELVRRIGERVASELRAVSSVGAAERDAAPDGALPPLSPEEAARLAARARSDLAKIALFIDQAWARELLPETIAEVEDRWHEQRSGAPFPVDPFDGYEYGYERDDQGGYVLWSPGPDRADDTDDDLERVGPMASEPRI